MHSTWWDHAVNIIKQSISFLIGHLMVEPVGSLSHGHVILTAIEANYTVERTLVWDSEVSLSACLTKELGKQHNVCGVSFLIYKMRGLE